MDLFGALLLASCKNRAFWCFPFETMCFLVLSLVLEIVLFGVLLHAKKVVCVALLRAVLSFVRKSWSRWCFLVLSSVQKIVLFGVLLCAEKRAFWCSLAR